jgi:peptidoglycan/xylan/chitin deacetylase (PgdA/CDA1 family)
LTSSSACFEDVDDKPRSRQAYRVVSSRLHAWGMLMRLLLTAMCVAGLIAVGASCTRHGRTTARARSTVTQKASPPQADAIWVQAGKEIYKTQEELQQQRARELEKGLRYDVLWRGNVKVPAVALTFDDGPHPDYTPSILAILKRYNVRATFFVVGEMAEKYPKLIQAEKSAGHVIGNHTYHHVNLTKIPVPEVLVEWQACQDAVKSITGQTMHFCRPPGGDYNHDVMLAAQELGLTTVVWTDDPGDYASPGDKVIETRVLDKIGSGGIILIHDGIQQTIDVLPQIIERLRTRGFRFVTAAEMYGESKTNATAVASPQGYRGVEVGASHLARKTGAQRAAASRMPARGASYPQKDALPVHPQKD